ncbi:MAG: hypothetical protein HYV41_04710 [Candidatus Magasanikbacteria bacterium]|nr:hypothetical protein [Candidatus Magasanikbacteria bacterium]
MQKYPTWIRLISPLVAVVLLLIFLVFAQVYVSIGVIVLWSFFFILLDRRYHVARQQTALSGMTALSFIILIALIEAVWLRWFFVGLSVPFFFFIAYWWEPRIERAIHIKEKPLRRIMMMVYVFNVYAFLLGVFAVHLYFPMAPFWILSFVAGLYAAFGAYMIWNLYFKIRLTDSVVWTMIIAFMVIELMWVLRLLPFGYLALGLLTVWVWYIVQLFIRFHLGSKGILWNEQRGFIIGNVVLYIFVLYIIRWI